MLNTRVRQMGQEWLPGFLLNRLVPFEAQVDREVTAFEIALPAGASVLDAGAGECRYAKFFSRHHYVSLDSGVGDVSWDYTQLNLFGDLEQLPLAAGTFDAAISIVTLEHARHPEQVLRETERILRPGGQLFLVVPNQWEVHQAPHDFFRYTRYGVEDLLTRTGFEVKRLQPLGGFFWMMSRRCINLLTFFQGGWKWIFFILLAPFFGLLFPLLLYFLDPLDRKKDFTLGYVCVAQSKALPFKAESA